MRVYTIAINLHSTSRYVMDELRRVGVRVKSPSSQVEPICAAAFMAVEMRKQFEPMPIIDALILHAYGSPPEGSFIHAEDLMYGEEEFISYCPACGEPIDYCQGHGEIGDPWGARILELHDAGIHEACHPNGCDERAKHILPDGVRNLDLHYNPMEENE